MTVAPALSDFLDQKTPIVKYYLDIETLLALCSDSRSFMDVFTMTSVLSLETADE